MNNIKKFLTAIFFILPLLVATIENPKPARANSYQQTIAVIGSYYNYREFSDNGSLFIANRGGVAGANYLGHYRFGYSPIGVGYVSPDVTIYGGSLLYHSAKSGDHNNANYLLAEARALVGYEFNLASLHHINFFAGVGYRFTGNFDAGKTTTDGFATYDRVNHLGYIPVGGSYIYGNSNSEFTIAVRGEYDIFLGGTQLTYTEPASIHQEITPPTGIITSITNIPYFNTTSNPKPFANKQTKGYGFKTSLAVTYQQFLIQPFFNYWSIETSDNLNFNYDLPCVNDSGITTTCTGGQGIGSNAISEPANSTLEAGMSIGYGF